MNRYAALLLSSLPLACFDGEALTEGKPCASDADCGGDLRCVSQVCADMNSDDDGGDDDADDGADDAFDGDGGGDPCSTGLNECADADTLAICVAGTIETRECQTVCEQSGYLAARGCLTDANGGRCVCDATTAPCTTTAGTFDCVGNVSRECVAVNQPYTYVDCDQYCNNELGQVATTCDYYQTMTNPALPNNCVCAPQTCYDNASYCDDEQTERRCVLGAWSTITCSNAECQTRCMNEGYCYDGNTGPNESFSLGCSFDISRSDFHCLCTNTGDGIG